MPAGAGRIDVIDVVDRRLKAWVTSVVEGIEVCLTQPSASKGKPSVGLYLLDLLRTAPSASPERRLPLQLSLRYLVTAWADSPEEAHGLLGTVVFAAMEHPEFQIDLEPLSPEVWRAFGTAPRPSFLMRVPLQLPRPEPAVGRVRLPIEVRYSPVTGLRGQVLGPGKIPLAAVRVEIPGLSRSMLTDADGCFRFDNVPLEPAVKRLRIEAKGKEFWVDAAPGQGDVATALIHLEALEV
jgi:hypothetical protein